MKTPTQRAKRKLHASTATYHTAEGLTCDLEELAVTYLNTGQIPERINFRRACEIGLLSKAFLILYRADRRQRSRK